MYKDYFGFSDLPFSIAPDPNYLYLSEQHKEALAHLLYGVGDHGGFVLLSGEVGTGKTTICRALLHQMPDHCEVAYVVNPRQTDTELLRSICDEFGIYYFYEGQGSNYLVDLINEHLLALHAKGQNAVLIVDEAQNLGVDVLEQLRLLTNLETDQKKLLQLILLGQPELNELLAKPELRQLAQRITARHHLKALTEGDVSAYVAHRLQIAGFRGSLFSAEAIKLVYRKSKGIPRIINVICDRCLLGVYSTNGNQVTVDISKRAVGEVLGMNAKNQQLATSDGLKVLPRKYAAVVGLAAAFLIGLIMLDGYGFTPSTEPNTTRQVTFNSEDSVSEEQAERINAGAELNSQLGPSRLNSQPSKDSLLTTKEQLLQRLAKRIGFEGDASGNVCDSLYQNGFRCLARTSELNTILLLETTIVAKLPHSVLPPNQLQGEADSQWVMLTALPGKHVEVEFANQQRLALPPATLAAAWPAEYYWLWQPPQNYRQSLSLGEADEFVSWLSAALSRFEQGSAQYDLENDTRLTDSSTTLQRSGFLLSAHPSSVDSVVSTGLLRRLNQAKQKLKLSAPGVPQELAHILARPFSKSAIVPDASSLAMRDSVDPAFEKAQ